MKISSENLVLLNIFTLMSCSPYIPKNRQRRQQYESDDELMGRYWGEVLPLGFFINQGAAETGDNSAKVSLSLRDKIQKVDGMEGSGTVRRDDIEPKPTSSISPSQKVKNPESNEKVDKEETEKLGADFKEGNLGDSAGDKTSDDDPDRKVRTSVTCQGQKEWIQCDGPYELIKIRSAFWGRDNPNTCKKSGYTHGLSMEKECAQDESNTMSKVREACDNENVCEVVASGIYFDKTDCPDIYKFLKLEWECARSESRIKEIYR